MTRAWLSLLIIAAIALGYVCGRRDRLAYHRWHAARWRFVRERAYTEITPTGAAERLVILPRYVALAECGPAADKAVDAAIEATRPGGTP